MILCLLSPADSSRETWKSSVYNHYNITVRRDEDGKTFYYVFSCKYNHPGHQVLERARMKNGNGTTNLKNANDRCDRARGVHAPETNHALSAPQYSPARHRALIALRCAVHNRPVNSVNDALYHEEVQLLRPGTIIPSDITVARDITFLYHNLAKRVKKYFVVRSFSYNMAHVLNFEQGSKWHCALRY